MIARAFAFVMRALPLDARARRAVDEVLADWRFEAGRAPSAIGRLQNHLRCTCALFAVVALTAFRELGDVPRSRIPVLAALWIIVPYVVTRAMSTALQSGSYGSPALFVVDFAAYATLFLPLALFLALDLDRRSSIAHPHLGLAFASILCMSFVVGWIQPALNQWYREAWFAATGGAGALEPGLRELPLNDLLVMAFPPDTSRTALSVLGSRLSLILACPLALVLATHTRVRRWHRYLVPIVAFAAYDVLVAVAFSTPALFWIMPATLILLTIGLARSGAREARAAR